MAKLLKYEIAHDLLARQVFARFSAEEKTLRKAERLLVDSYELHSDLIQNGEGSRLLNREELVFLRPYLPQIRPDQQLTEYLTFSEQTVAEAELAETRKLEAEIARQQEEQKHQRKWLIAAIGAGLVMLAIAIFAGISYKQANDRKIALRESQDSLTNVNTYLKHASEQIIVQKDIAQKKEQQAVLEKQRADTLTQLAISRLFRLQKAQDTILSREKEALIAKRRSDSLKNQAEKLTKVAQKEKELAQARFAALGDAQVRELGKLKTAIYHLQYEQGLRIILDATKLGVFNVKVRDALLELAFYYHEINRPNLTDSLMELVVFMEGTSRGGDNNSIEQEYAIKERAGKKLTNQLQQRYFPTMLPVEGGAFIMGELSKDQHKKTHQVYLKDFEISRHEVTVYQYELFLSAEGRSLSEKITPGWAWRGDHPMVNIDWYDAIRYCNWLSRKRNLVEVYQINGNQVDINWDANGFRLPTEAEWEYAAGGGKAGRTTEGYRNNDYAGSNSLDAIAWYNVEGSSSRVQSKAMPVGQKTANELGLYDMSGNVWEWCNDWYGAYVTESVDNPKGIRNGNNRVARGGSWDFDSEVCRVDYRSRYLPTLEYDDLGFRLVRNK